MREVKNKKKVRLRGGVVGAGGGEGLFCSITRNFEVRCLVSFVWEK